MSTLCVSPSNVLTGLVKEVFFFGFTFQVSTTSCDSEYEGKTTLLTETSSKNYYLLLIKSGLLSCIVYDFYLIEDSNTNYVGQATGIMYLVLYCLPFFGLVFFKPGKAPFY